MPSPDPVLAKLPDGVQDFFSTKVAPFYFTIMLVLVLILVWMWWKSGSEHATMPTTTMYDVAQDSVNVGGSGGGAFPLIQAAISTNAAQISALEGMEGGAPAVVTAAVDPNSSVMPGSPNWVILNNPGFGCASRVPIGDDYRAYQQNNMRTENAVGGRGLDDPTAMRILNGE